MSAILVALGIATAIAAYSIRNLGRDDADEMLHLTCATGAMNLETYFDSVEHSVETVATLVQDSFEGMAFDQLGDQVERARNLFDRVAYHTNGVLTYYFRIDPEVSESVKGFWYVKEDGKRFREHEVTDIRQYDTTDTSALVWFTVPKATGQGVWLPPYYTENLDVRVISYNVPVYWNGAFVGVIGIEIDYAILEREVENIRIFQSGHAFILDEESNVIYHPQLDSMKLELEITAIHEPENYIGSNHIEYIFEGVRKEAVWMPLSNGMRLYVAAPQSEIDSGWQRMICNILLASLIILVIVGFAMMRFAGRLMKPLRDLTEAAKRADREDYSFTLDYDGDDEVGVLTKTFKELTAHTRRHIDNLNARVYTDALTSMKNKGGYSVAIQKIQDQIDDPKGSDDFAFVVFDCDDLKRINDTYGHDKGDIYLKCASRLISRVFRHSPVFRIGGDEFAVILQNEDFYNRDALIEQFWRSSEEITAAAETPWEQIHVALGLAVYDPQLDAAAIDVSRRADKLMYENKRQRKEGKGK